MGFYGNITNVNKSTFQFDKIYSNRKAAADGAATDGIFVGRYVLVDYDTVVDFDQLMDTLQNIDENADWIAELRNETGTSAKIVPGYKMVEAALVDPTDPTSRAETDVIPYEFHTGVMHTTPIYIPKEDLNDPSYVITGYEVLDGQFLVAQGKIVHEITVVTEEGTGTQHTEESYTYVPFRKSEYELYVVHQGEFKKATAELSTSLLDNIYLTNYGIDKVSYNQIGRGWDSTVWQKIFNATTGNMEYVMIAELNSVVPTFDITVDAPTVTPIAPHWDADTSNVYYKLHLQPSWGMRVRHASEAYSSNDTEYPSDLNDDFYWDSHTKLSDQDLAVYWNKDGFNKYKGKHSEEIEANKILVEPTGKSLSSSYNTPDTYELSIMLPAVGNIMSDIWDMIYGERTEYDLEGNALLIPKNPVEIADSENLLRNTNYRWNTRNGERMTRKLVIETDSSTDPITQTINTVQGYNKKALNNLAGTINSVHDLMGMIIVEFPVRGTNESEADFNQRMAKWTAADLDPNNIYYRDGKYYIKERQYNFVAENTAKIAKTDMITKEVMVSAGNYYRLSLLDYDNYDDIYDEIDDPEEPKHILIRNYYKVNQNTVLNEAEVYGTLSHSSVGELNLINFNIGEDGNLFEKNIRSIPNNNSASYIEYIKKMDGSPEGKKYFTLEITPEEKITYYIPRKYYLGVKHFEAGTNDKATWLAKTRIDNDDFDSLSLRSEYTAAEALAATGLNNSANDDTIGYKWLKDVTLDASASSYIYVDVNRKQEKTIASDTHIHSDTVDGKIILTYEAFEESQELQNVESIIENNEEYYQYYVSTYSDKNYGERHKYIDNGETVRPASPLKTLKEWVEYWSALDASYKETELDLTLEIDLQRQISVPVYTTEGASIVTLEDVSIVTPYFIKSGNNYIQITRAALEANNGAGSDDIRAAEHWYSINATEQPVYYDVSAEYYLEDENDNLIRETATKLRVDDEHALNEEYEEVTGWETVADKGKVLFIPNTYYYKDGNGKFHLAATINDATEFYRYPDQYVNTDSNNIFEQGTHWNPNATPPEAVSLSYKQLTWGLRELPDFVGKLESLHGLILKIHNLLLEGDMDTRDRATVQGAINVLNDIIDKFHTLIPTEIVMVDDYGRIHSGDWDTIQGGSYINIGTNATTTINETSDSWVKLTPSIGQDHKPHLKLEHQLKHKLTGNAATTTTVSDKNTDRPNNTYDGLNASINGTDKDKLVLYTPIVDNMGHIIGKNTETVTLPYGFKTVTVSAASSAETDLTYVAGDIVAENTQDTVSIVPANKWVKLAADATNDTITIGHVVNSIDITDATATDINGNGNTITVNDIINDLAGHITSNKAHTYTLPYGFKYITGNGGTLEADNTQDTAAFSGDTWIQTAASSSGVAFTHIGPDSSVTHTTVNNETPKFGKTFTITDLDFDTKGHKANNGTHTVTIPAPSITGSGNVVNGATLDSNGDFTLTKTNVGLLALTGYDLSDNSTSEAAIAATDTINGAIERLEYRINALTSDYTATGANASSGITSNSTVNVISKIALISGKIVANNSTSVLVDAAGAAAAAETAAKGYADSLASNYVGVNADLSTKTITASNNNSGITDSTTTATLAAMLKKLVELESRLATLEAASGE